LTHRSGSPALLSLIYSEILKMLRLWGLLYFDAEIFYPHDVLNVPKGYHKQKSKESDQAHIMTSGNLLVEVISNYLIFFCFYYSVSPFSSTNIKNYVYIVPSFGIKCAFVP
jgi:hypothetical protein